MLTYPRLLRLGLLTSIPLFFVYVVVFRNSHLGVLNEKLAQGGVANLTWLTNGAGDDGLQDAGPEQNGLFIAQGMQSWVEDHPLDVSDFAKKGDRVNALAGLVKIVKDQEYSKKTPWSDTWSSRLLKRELERTLEWEFPWWSSLRGKRRNDEFRPWEKSWWYRPHDTGIVICVGKSNFLFATQLILTLRNVLGSKAPIELAYAGEEDLPVQYRSSLRNLGPNIELVNVLDSFDEARVGLADGKYAIKPFAVLASSYPHVILLDADTVLLQNPDDMLTRFPSYDSTGLLFFHDRAYKTDNTRRDWISSKLHFRNLSKTLTEGLFWREDLWQEMESGVVGIDKTRPEAFMTVLFAAWMNTKDVREKETYEHVLGDKETWWLAAEFARLDYGFVKEYAGIIGTSEMGKKTKICSTHILHMDDTGQRPLWFNGGLVENKALLKTIQSGAEDKQEEQDKREDQNSEKVKDVELGTFTDFMAAGTAMKDMPMWEYTTDEIWCAQGIDVMRIEDVGMTQVMGDVIREGKNAAEKLQQKGLLG